MFTVLQPLCWSENNEVKGLMLYLTLRSEF